jgi:SNF2 family DNA or RNA helicase
MQSRKKSKERRTSGNPTEKRTEKTLAPEDLERVEFHRHAFALMPEAGDRRPGVAFFVSGERFESQWHFCSCSMSKKRTCPHILKLKRIYNNLNKKLNGKLPSENFKSSIWFRLARILGETIGISAQSIQMRAFKAPSEENSRYIKISDANGNEMLTYLSQGPDALRLMERLLQAPGDKEMSNRAAVLGKLSRLTLSENEGMMLERGFMTRGLALEESFWYRFCYHSFREFDSETYAFNPAIEESTGVFTITCNRDGGVPLFRAIIPRHMVRVLLNTFEKWLPNQHNMPIHPIPLKSIFKISMNTEMDLDLLPMIHLIQEDGEESFLNREDLERYRYGDLVYIKELGLMAELEKPDSKRKFRTPVRMTLKKSQIPTFLEAFEDELREGRYILDEKVETLRIFKDFDHVEINPKVIDRDWCWIDVKYGFGNTAVSLKEILSARREGHRFIGTPEGWVDCHSEKVGAVSRAFSELGFENESDRMRLSRMDLFRIKATITRPLSITGENEPTQHLNQILAMRPSRTLPPLKGMHSTLRPYQKLGVNWILFLFENGFGGLLCDDMGLGKTHQATAFMVALKALGKFTHPCLVVCPTTVISHWQNKIREHAPALRAKEYHGGQRNLDDALKDGEIILTTYGILLRDIGRLKQQSFTLAVFDEIQNIKNPQTQTHRAAAEIRAEMKLGLTGTPIENSLIDLKALMDLGLPGYLGTDDQFITRYVREDELDPDGVRKKELIRLVSPFTLRRLKKTVLTELPEKIVDFRTCRLSEDQVRLYRDAIATKGKGFLKILRQDQEPVPYMHIFALLSLLKQICNHPALVSDNLKDFEQYQSGKWELFKELIWETLDSGQKAVVFSQYLGMIDIIEKYLQKQGAGFVTLTGSSRNRGKIIDRFNNDPDCKVYVGSLKAGGTGIDLTAASVVIHYDRWWNAAREDQATDRVHRFGQKRGVQVFKLITEGTLEEKISALIDRKRRLMDSVIKEDDPRTLKVFSREDLIDLISFKAPAGPTQ